jgi:Zn finger protein HypA/HybF involved in hydrogenase expression
MSETNNTSDEALRLDGNAAAGMLAEIFAVEMTSAESTCAHCGRIAAMGTLLLYGGEMGAVLRCPGCDSVQMRVAHSGGRYRLDMRGIAMLSLARWNPT